MEINKDGAIIAPLYDYLSKKTDKTKEQFDENFYIKPEGVIDNILTSLAFMEYYIQEQIMFLLKQFDPETAEREYQDGLYERVGLYRSSATKTTFKKKLLAEADTFIPANSVTIKSSETDEEFTNSESLTTDSSGIGEMSFEAVIPGHTEVRAEESFILAECPQTIIELSNEEAYDISLGENEETDSEFKTRFHELKNYRAKCSRNAIIHNLCDYVEHKNYLNVIDGNTDPLIDAGYIKVIAKPSVSDEEFAKAILENVLCGIKFLGNTAVSVPLSNGTNLEVKFQKASDIGINLSGEIKIKSGFFANTVIEQVKENILNYAQTRIYGLGATIYATEFVLPILDTEGVEAVTSISVKNFSDAEYSANTELAADELPLFSQAAITLTLT